MPNAAAFFSYIFLSAFTPGPNNIMAMASAGKYGLKRGFRFCVGVLLGFFVVMSCCAFFSTILFRFIPKIRPFMTAIGAGYILWLAWTVWRDKPKGAADGESRNDGVLTGMVLQFVNVKVILYGITALSSFILPYYASLHELAFFVALLALTGFLGTCCWALFGTVFQKAFVRYRKELNAVMALLLVYCAASMIV